MAAPMIVRSHSTNVAEEASEYIRDVYVDHELVVNAVDERFTFEQRSAQVADLLLDDLSLGMDATFPTVGEGLAQPTLVQVRRGDPLTMEIGGEGVTVAPGESVLMRPSTPYTVRWRYSSLRLTVLPGAVLTDCWSGRGLDARSRLPRRPVGRGAAEHLADVDRLVRRLATSPVELGPVARAEMVRMYSSAAEVCFAGCGETVASSPAVPAAVRRAAAFVEDHAHEPIGLAEIAAAAGLSTRGTQAAFRRHLGTTPLEHLRRTRLAGAHRVLQEAAREDGVTVAATALDWGFLHAGRFSQWYRRSYGCSPQQTLDAPPS
ncbi:AraC family transcriptional regulator [Auraticoccus monumenti]|uniref:AraC-type DNA-binding protein n=1 Tax=Auraticoccus monumenti TaxID=675864 RepID=A0A1G6WJK7_9ACTN|nr:helix-turn-helix domain-containing protein [Auraticoccus monumenti]SDD66150.1 AraC-type DNA-binding protein [Auraticoccus monumenti]